MSSSPLSALVDILASQVKALEAAYAKAGQPVPSLDAPFQPSPLDMDPAIAGIKAVVVAAADQLIASVRFPIESLQIGATSLYITTVLGLVEEYNIADILIQAGPQGLHVNDISKVAGPPADVIARLLRFLATRHIFKELTPNVFTNNRLSTVLCKGKPVAEIKADPIGRFDNGPFAGFISLCADDALASASQISKFLREPGDAEAPFNIARKTPLKLWEWYEQPGNEWRVRRFTVTMEAGAAIFPPDIVINSINGSALKDDSVVVDVGGSVGSAALLMYKTYPNLKYIIQDLQHQQEPAKAFWKEKAPEALESGRVSVQLHNFFDPQPVKDAAVYFMRVVIHDWPDDKAQIILNQTRDAAGPHSKLVLLDSLQNYTCAEPGKPKLTPDPLLANLGIGGAGFFTALDIDMLNMFNGKERTEADFRALGEATGWKLESVTPGILATYVFTAA